MVTSNITLGENVDIDPNANVNNVILGNNVKIRKDANVFGSKTHPLIVGNDTKISIMSTLNGFDAPLTIGERCGISRNVNMMTGSGPWSEKMRKAFPIVRKPINIGDDCWIGADVVIMPGVDLGKFCIVGSNSFVTKSFPAYSIIGGSPAKLIRTFTQQEIDLVEGN